MPSSVMLECFSSHSLSAVPPSSLYLPAAAVYQHAQTQSTRESHISMISLFPLLSPLLSLSPSLLLLSPTPPPTRTHVYLLTAQNTNAHKQMCAHINTQNSDESYDSPLIRRCPTLLSSRWNSLFTLKIPICQKKKSPSLCTGNNVFGSMSTPKKILRESLK